MRVHRTRTEALGRKNKERQWKSMNPGDDSLSDDLDTFNLHGGVA